jgi:DNA-binding MarR family transcriptional regulator
MTKPIYDPRTFEPRNSAGALVAMLRKAFLEAIDAELAPLDISAAQWMVIMVLSAKGEATAGELAKDMNHDPGAMTRLVDRLENKGMLKRAPSASDRRAVALQLTRAGQALRPKICTALANVNNRLLHGFTREEVNQLEGFLTRMLANA